MIDKIEALRKEQKMSKTTLTGLTNVSLPMYYKYLKGSAIPYETVESMLKALGYVLLLAEKIPGNGYSVKLPDISNTKKP